jgi:ResB-like family
MLLKRLVKFFTSLRLTVVLLAFAIIIVFIGTLAQVDEGLYRAQASIFHQWIILGANLFGHQVPLLLPGGYLIGTLLLLNLIAAHIYRFQLSVKKIGIQLAHAGVILLLLGQLMTDMFAHESQIEFTQGQTKWYSVSPRSFELVFTTSAGTNRDQVIAFPARQLARGGVLENKNLPFTVRAKWLWKNSDPSFRAPMMQNKPPLATNGVAGDFDFTQRPETTAMDSKNVPTALIELNGPDGPLGDWVVSDWTDDEPLVAAVKASYDSQVGSQMASQIIAKLTAPQSVGVGGRQYTFELRPTRYYNPFSLTLLKATHTVYEGTDIPKDFRSLVRIDNPQTGEDREVDIYMNHPLRYDGLTFYQYQMDAGQATQQAGRAPSSVLQVVHNPSWLTPYIGCAMVAAGLVTQFMFHLVGFVSKRKKK